MRLANFKRVRGLDREWKLLRRPAKHNLPFCKGDLPMKSLAARTGVEPVHQP
jgi:hypothetical protein